MGLGFSTSGLQGIEPESGTQEPESIGMIEKNAGCSSEAGSDCCRKLFGWKYCSLASLRSSGLLDIRVVATRSKDLRLVSGPPARSQFKTAVTANLSNGQPKDHKGSYLN